MNNLARLYLHDNRLSGRVPDGLGWCTSLEELYLGNNRFEGEVTSFLKPLKALQYVDLSRNNFSGQIPRFLENLQLIYLNLSFNRFEGEVPNQGVFLNATGVSVIGNGNICGGMAVLSLPSCHSTKRKHQRSSPKTIIATTSGIAVMFIVLLLVAYTRMKRNKRRNEKPHMELLLQAPFPQISFEDILKATQGLNRDNLIGTGSFGSVYKGNLENIEKTIAIKVLDLQNRAASKSFMAECEALRNIRHRNLVKIVTACSTVDFQGNDFKALMYEYMENGSLDGWLHPEATGREGPCANGRLSLTNRLCIANDVAHALEYLHYQCEAPIIHCDLKPSNVRLDKELTAHVGDFGLARILSDVEVVLQSSSASVKGTIGYSPPEYGIGSKVSREGDVYSYGILLLEMLTGKRPTDDMFQDTWNIQSYCEAALHERVVEIADPVLLGNDLSTITSRHAPSCVQECLVKVLEIGIGCCREIPSERMDIRDVATKLRSIKELAQ